MNFWKLFKSDLQELGLQKKKRFMFQIKYVIVSGRLMISVFLILGLI